MPVRAEDYDPKAIREALHAILAPESAVIDGYVLDTEELRQFYASRDYKSVWDTNPAGDRESLKNFLKSVKTFAGYHAIVQNHYPDEPLTALIASDKVTDCPKIEILTTAWILKLAHDLHGNTVNLANIYPGWKFQREPVDIPANLEKAVEENRVYDFISSLVPSNPAYLRLARGLKAYRTMAETGDWPEIGEGPTIHPGENDKRIPAIRARLMAEDYLQSASQEGGESDVYDKDLEQAVQNYQGRNGLKPDGAIGAKTVDALNVPLDERIGQIAANMERWRHMPQILPSRYVMVNIASATVEAMDEGQSLYRGPVVVGRRDRKTPFIHSLIRSVIFNPSWHVPAKIARKDILPKLRRDPHYLEKMGFVIKGSADDPHGDMIDWNDITESDFNFRLRQSPGDINSLGRLKFDFDNDFSVYMHGTPHKELFDKAERNQSSGCVRLRDPDVFATIVLAHNEKKWDLERVQNEIDTKKTHWLKVAEPLPLYFVYWTVFPAEDDGPLNFRQDVYNYDGFLLDVLHEQDKKESTVVSRERSIPLT